MNISLDYFNKKNKRDRINHVFVLTNPLVVFISKMIIEKYKIPEEKIILISYRNTNTNLLKGKILNHKTIFIDKNYSEEKPNNFDYKCFSLYSSLKFIK